MKSHWSLHTLTGKWPPPKPFLLGGISVRVRWFMGAEVGVNIVIIT